MKRPANISSSAVLDSDTKLWIVSDTDGLYDIRYIYNQDGELLTIIEMEI